MLTAGARRRWRALAGVAALLLATLAGAAEGEAPPVILAVSFGVTDIPTEEVAGRLRQSPLFAATDAVGVPDKLAIQLSDMFAEEVDFLRDLNHGFQCTLVYEMYYPNGMPVPGRILAARFATPERRIEAYLFPLGKGQSAYFDGHGLDVNKTLQLVEANRATGASALPDAALDSAFRRSPLEFSRITSRPSAARYHPILKEWRAHRGTDYGAPVGTKVRATAEGVVTYVGPRNNYGNLVEIRHFDRYTTRYGHLNGFAPGLAVGQTVAKGQIIGEVGMTGLATGPHLHYELHADPGAKPPERLAFAIRDVPMAGQAAFVATVARQRHLFDYAERANQVVLSWSDVARYDGDSRLAAR